ncbi:MAG: F0F1 ATP synthase subunit gamma [Candidatus Omnitrophica bacterium]|nr:F0F1 ATP synthase subunit gamma [Candidatus Omnitrophota bacterium]
MKPLSTLKKDMEFNKNLGSLLETLKSIAVSQYRALEKKLTTFKELMTTINSFFDSFDISDFEHPFLAPANDLQAVVAVTSDTGLLGGLNARVVNTALGLLREKKGKLIIIGERGKRYVQDSGVPSVAFSGIRDEDRYAQAVQMRDYLLSKILEGSFGYLKVVYPKPISFTIQRVETVHFLPFDVSRGKSNVKAQAIKDIILESSPTEMAEYLIYTLLGQSLFEIFGMSRLSEFAARYVHLEESAQKLKDMDKKLRLQYFRTRHEFVDRNMRELFASRLLFSH